MVDVGPEIGDIGELDGVRPAPLPHLLDRAGHLDPLGGHAVLVDQHREQDRDAADQLDPPSDALPRRLEDLLADPRRGHRGTDERAQQLADAADQCQADVGDRGEVAERLVADRAEPERQDDAAQRGDRRRQREREELGHHHVDPERRRRPFVGADGDQPTAAAATSHVGDHHDRQHRHDQHEDPVALRVVDRADVVAEQVGVADLGALHPAGVVAVLEQHQLDGGSQAERDDRQVDPPGAHRRQTEDQPERHRGGDAGQQSEEERDVEHRDQPSGDVGAEAGDRVLGEGELSGVPGQHDDRQQDDRHAQRHGDGVDPLRLLGHHHEDDGAAAEQRPGPRRFDRCRASAAVAGSGHAAAATGPGTRGPR